MSAPPTHWEWWYPAAGDPCARLHYIAEAADPAWYRRVCDTDGSALVTAACGLRARFAAAGIVSRMSRPRCARCCARLGIPCGEGTPRNEARGVRVRREAARLGAPDTVCRR